MSGRSTLPLLVASILLASNSARAGDPAAAEALFHEARELMAQGRYREACPKFEESQRSDAGLGTQFHLADCWQHLGRTASAWALFREVESGARALGQTSRERVARDRAVALEPFISKIVIAPHDAAATPGVDVRRDGAPVGREQWDVSVPVDPGTHVVAATAPHKQPWQTNVEVLSDGKVVTVDIPPLAAVEEAPAVVQAPEQPPAPFAPPPPPAPPPPAKGVTSPMPSRAPETAFVEDRGAGQRAIGWTLVGVGIAGLTAGVYFGAQWIDDRSLIDAPCAGSSCGSLQQDARTQALRAEWLLVGGGATFLIGAVVVATAPRARIVLGAAKMEIVPILGRETGGLAVHGAW